MEKVGKMRKNEKGEPRIIVRLVGGGIRIVPVQDIIVVCSRLHVQRVTLRTAENVEIRQSLKELCSQLDALVPGQFISPGKGVLVNSLDVECVLPNHIVLRGGKTFSLANRQYRKFSKQVRVQVEAHNQVCG